jgi:hypothetical protein
VRGAVQFDDQLTFRTIKVDNVATNADLSSEEFSQDLFSLKVRPQNSLGGSAGIAEFSASVLFRAAIEDDVILSHAGERSNAVSMLDWINR